MNKNENEEMAHVYIPKRLADKVKELKDAPDKILLQYIEDCKKDIKSSIECFSEDVLIFKGQTAQVRKEFGEAKREHLETSYEMWENYDKDVKTVRDCVSKITAELAPLKEELNKIKDLYEQISHWKVRGLLETLTFVAEKTQYHDQIKFLIENFNAQKKEQ